MCSDLRDIKNASIGTGLYRGFSMYLAASILSRFGREYVDPNQQLSQSQYFTLYYSVNLSFRNPMILLANRMQHLDYPMERGVSLTRAFLYLYRTEGPSILLKGQFAHWCSSLVKLLFIIQSEKCTKSSNRDLIKYSMPCIFAAYLCTQPMNLISKKVMCGPILRSEVERKAYRNTLSACIYTAKTEGVLGFYRGFVPMILLNMTLDYIFIKRAARAILGES